MNKRQLLFAAGTVLFLVSGFAGLVYEVVWFKRFAVVWGNSTAAMACVVASFLAGLGIGARLAGNWADRVQMPFRYYGLLEVGIGIVALLIPWEIIVLEKAASFIYPAISGYPIIHAVIRLVLTFLAIGPACIMMGATLPLLVSQFSRDGSTHSMPVACFYALNTLGAAIGCFTAGFYLLPAIGLKGTNLIAVSLNIGVGLVSLALARWLSPKGLQDIQQTPTAAIPSEQPLSAVSTVSSPIPVHVLNLVVLLSGCAALMLQVAWTRQLTIMLGGSTYAFSAMLVVILLGIGLGSLIYEFGGGFIRRHAIASLSTCVLLLSLAVLAGKRIIPELSAVMGLLKPIRGEHLGNAAVCLFASALVEFIPALILGVLFPLYVHLAKATNQTAGSATGRIYAFNTWGTIIGAAVTGLALIPRFGTVGIATVALFMFVVALGLVAVVMDRPQRRVLTAGIVVGLIAVVGVSAKLDPRDTDKGKFMYGYSEPYTYNDEVLYFREGRACNVLVTDSKGHRSLRVNGKVDASNRGDMNMQLGLAFFPRFLRPAAENVLVIGFGSGTTSGASLLFPGTKVDCCEIEPAVYQASQHFSQVNHSPEKSRDFRMIFDDARAYVQGARQQYDLILSEPSNPWMAGVSSLFTVEFYQHASDRLKPDGILAQWIQTYSFSVDAYRSVMRTASSVFRHSALVRISEGDTILLTSQAPLVLNPQTLRSAEKLIAASPLVAADLRHYFDTTNVVDLLIRHVLLSESAVRGIVDKTSPASMITDYNLRLEFDTPALLFNSEGRGQAQIHQTLSQAVDPAGFEALLRLSSDPAKHVDSLHTVAKHLVEHKAEAPANAILDLALRHSPEHSGILITKASLDPERNEPTLIAAIDKMAERSITDANKLGVVLWKNSRYESAVKVFQAVVSKNPTCVTAWVNLGINREALKEFKSAEEAFKRALDLNPLDDFAKESYQKFLRNPQVPAPSQKETPVAALGL